MAVVLGPVLALGLFASEGDLLTATARFDGLIVAPAAIFSATVCYAAWRINPRPGLAWTTVGLAILGSQELVHAAALLIRPQDATPGFWMPAADLTMVLVVVLAVSFAHVAPWRWDPAGTGFTLGAVVAVVGLAWLDGSGDLGQQLPRWLVSVVYVAVVLTAAGTLWWGGGLSPRIGSIPGWARRRTALVIVLVSGAHLALYLGDSGLVHTAVVVANTSGAAILVATCLVHFISEVDAADTDRSDLSDKLVGFRRSSRADRATLHEVRSTIAGITSASGLLRSSPEITDERRVLLEDMLFTELGRLGRLVTPPSESSEPRTTDLDEVIRTLVVSREARGNRVHWSPSGLRVGAESDAVAEVINVLLDNAAEHGHSEAEVSLRQVGDIVEVAVHDDGPGVDESLRDRLFTWGARGSGSTGQGIGLHIASELARRQGGFLELRDCRSGGATFVMGLPVDRADPWMLGEDDQDESFAELA